MAGNILIIEDSAELIGQKYYNKKCGSFGDISTFSFYANKHITTGEGGMILTDNYKLYNKSKSLRSTRNIYRQISKNKFLTIHKFSHKKTYPHQEFGILSKFIFSKKQSVRSKNPFDCLVGIGKYSNFCKKDNFCSYDD